jgi:hypothetical protein
VSNSYPGVTQHHLASSSVRSILKCLLVVFRLYGSIVEVIRCWALGIV